MDEPENDNRRNVEPPRDSHPVRVGPMRIVMHHYPFHLGDYIRATAHLDLIEDCVYRRLIDLYMETESPIPNETQQVIRRLRLGSSGLILDAILNEFFTLEDDNCWHNKRCDDEIREFRRLAEVSRINGKLGGRPKKTQQVILDNPAITQQEPVGLQPIPNTQYPSKPPISPKGDAVKFDPLKIELPACIPADVWTQWVTHRVQIKKRLTELAAKEQLAALARWHADGFDPTQIIKKSVTNGWTGLFEPDKAMRSAQNDDHQFRGVL